MSFLLCQGCSRHVKSSEDACPFCGASTSSAAKTGNPGMVGARQRSRLLFGAAAAAVAGATAITGCSTTSIYGAPTSDAGVHTDGGAGDEGGSVVLYGAPYDAGEQDSGGPVPLYGAAVTDSGTD